MSHPLQLALVSGKSSPEGRTVTNRREKALGWTLAAAWTDLGGTSLHVIREESAGPKSTVPAWASGVQVSGGGPTKPHDPLLPLFHAYTWTLKAGDTREAWSECQWTAGHLQRLRT